MTNFNSVNNLNFNNIQNPNVQNTKNNSGQKNDLQQLPKAPVQSYNPTINPSLMYNLETAKMDNETVLKYLKSLLDLPNSIEKFIQEINSNNKDSKLIKLLVQNLINTKALSEYLNDNSKSAMDKIFKAISLSTKQGNQNTSELREIFNILSALQSQSQINSNTLKEFLLLYIPINYQIFDKPLEFNKVSKNIEEKINNSELSIMFETINFSNILCILNSDNYNLYIDFYSNKSFPSNKFIKVVDEFSKEAQLNPFIEFKEIKENKINNAIQNFKITSKSNISPNVLILAHLIIKVVFKIDNDFSN